MCSDNRSSSKTSQNRIKILTFHKLLSRLTFGSTNYSPRRLANLLSRLTESGYEFSSLDEALSEPETSLTLTFDDGYDHLKDALPPLLEKYELKPHIFIPTAYIGRPNTWDYSNLLRNDRHLDRSGIKLLADLGVEFGAHGHSHRPLTRLSDAIVAEELRQSKEILEDITGREIRFLSYPFGRFDRRIIDAASKAGFTHAFTMSFPSQLDEPLAMGRYPVYFYDTPFTVRQKVAGGRLYRFEQWKATATNRLSSGTGLYYHLIGKRRQGL